MQVFSVAGLVSLLFWLVLPALAVVFTFGQEEYHFLTIYDAGDFKERFGEGVLFINLPRKRTLTFA